jgi:enoyl-[acyl-carrier protein] reductase/trans-2-enoyl-CoA reductase (NAD+)
MVIKPMIRSNICMNAHPEGCALEVKREIDYVEAQPSIDGAKRVLIIGSSTGYGLATRIVAGVASGAKTLGVAYERPASGKRTATVGWYNTEAYERYAEENGLYAETIFGDAFSDEIKRQTIEKIKADLGSVDLVVYSLASGVRRDPTDGEEYRSALKPIGEKYSARSVDPMKGELTTAEVEPATEEEITATVKVMGGADWELWMKALKGEGVLAQGCITVTYSYIGPDLTQPIYREGTIGKAKEHLEQTADRLTDFLSDVGGRAFVSVNKAVVSRASAVIPVVPLYFAILFAVMEEKGLHEQPIHQMYRLFHDRLYSGGEVPVDEEGRIRLDDWEMREDVQSEVASRWERVTQDNLHELADIEGYRRRFLEIHGFGFDEIDYEKDVNP